MFCFQTCDIPAAENLGLYTYEFNDLPMSEDETLKSTIAMFRDSNIIKKFRIPYDVSEVLSTALCIGEGYHLITRKTQELTGV